MSTSKVEFCFYILKSIKKEIGEWQRESLFDIKDVDVQEIISLLRIFLKLKNKKNKK